MLLILEESFDRSPPGPYILSLPSPTRPGRPSKRRRLVDDEAQKARGASDESVQFVGTKLASERHYWRGYVDGIASQAKMPKWLLYVLLESFGRSKKKNLIGQMQI